VKCLLLVGQQAAKHGFRPALMQASEVDESAFTPEQIAAADELLKKAAAVKAQEVLCFVSDV
jgi:hypothetical protein